jgi:hypothetical protein
MRIVVNFLNPSSVGTSKVITKWNLVTFTYIVVSRNFDGQYSTIWATTAEASITSDIVGSPIDKIASVFTQVPAGSCVTYQDPNFVFDPACITTATAWTGANTPGGEVIVHAYIMGFQWNSNRSSNQFVAAGVFGNDPNDAAFDSSNA